MSDTIELLVTWAWERHHNILSWYVRPLFLLPYCWFAYRRSATGFAVTLIALCTSTAWFPAPSQPDPAVVRMLAVEREYLLGAWTPAKLALAAVVPLTFVALAAALWRRSVGWALVVVNAAVGVKIGGRSSSTTPVPAPSRTCLPRSSASPSSTSHWSGGGHAGDVRTRPANQRAGREAHPQSNGSRCPSLTAAARQHAAGNRADRPSRISHRHQF